MLMRALKSLLGSLLTTTLVAAAIGFAVDAMASTHTFRFESEPLTCDPSSLACENAVPYDLEQYAVGAGTTLAPLVADLTVDETLLPGGTLESANVSWFSELLNPGIFLNAAPDWLGLVQNKLW